jgi:UDP-N-acetylmuramate dehydrogenase
MKIKNETLKMLAEKVKGQCRFNEPMARHTSFKIGGPADLLVVPSDEEDLQIILSFINKHKLPYMAFGNGTNLLVLDGGIRGVVIKMTAGFRTMENRSGVIAVGAGFSLPRLVEKAAEMSLSGLEWGVGIPGSLGGALVMNAGAYGGQMSDMVKKVWGYTPQGDKLSIKASAINFGYRHSEYPSGFTIAGTEMELKELHSKKIKSVMENWMGKRQRNQPLSLPSAGCIFKNPSGDSARRLIAVSGLRGKIIGGARVSTKHANFIVNQGGAKARDVIKLIDVVKEKTYRETGFELIPEVKMIGEP